jgi:hypothetical protein
MNRFKAPMRDSRTVEKLPMNELCNMLNDREMAFYSDSVKFVVSEIEACHCQHMIQK